jgi:hypothetical protein
VLFYHVYEIKSLLGILIKFGLILLEHGPPSLLTHGDFKSPFFVFPVSSSLLEQDATKINEVIAIILKNVCIAFFIAYLKNVIAYQLNVGKVECQQLYKKMLGIVFNIVPRFFFKIVKYLRTFPEQRIIVIFFVHKQRSFSIYNLFSRQCKSNNANA